MTTPIDWNKDPRVVFRPYLGTAVYDDDIGNIVIHQQTDEFEQNDAKTLVDVLDRYYEDHAVNLESHADALASVNRLKAHFGAFEPSDIGPEAQEGFIAERRRRRAVSNDTINRDLAILSAALNRAYARKKIGQPYKVFMLPRAEPRDRYLTREELAKLYKHLRSKTNHKQSRHLLLFVRIAMNTGARSTAILQLTWDRVDFARRTIWFPLPGRRQTKKRRTVISFDHKLLNALLAARKLADAREKASGVKSTHVIEFQGAPIARIRRAIVRACTAVGIEDVSPHTFRHTFATWAAMGGAHLPKLGGALGHTNPSTTARYAKYQPEAFADVLRSARKKLR